MNFRTWFDQNRDSASKLAALFDVTDSAIHQWYHAGVPIDRMAGVEAFSKRKCRIADMAVETAELRSARRKEAA
jgi:hypothetical protein